MPIPVGGVPPRAVNWIFLAMAAVFAIVAAIRVLDRSPWPVVVVPAGLSVTLGGVAWLTLRFRKAKAPKDHKLAGPSR